MILFRIKNFLESDPVFSEFWIQIRVFFTQIFWSACFGLIRIPVCWSDLDPVFKIRSDKVFKICSDPVFNIWSDLNPDPVSKLGRIRIRSKNQYLKSSQNWTLLAVLNYQKFICYVHVYINMYMYIYRYVYAFISK